MRNNSTPHGPAAEFTAGRLACHPEFGLRWQFGAVQVEMQNKANTPENLIRRRAILDCGHVTLIR